MLAVSATLCTVCDWWVVEKGPSASAGTAQKETSISHHDVALGPLPEITEDESMVRDGLWV